MIGDLVQDLRYALRTLRRSPGFTLVAVLTLALGIGANTTIFSVVSAVLLRPPAEVHEPDRLVSVYTSDYSGPRYGTSSYADYLDFLSGTTQLSGLAAFAPSPLNFSTDGAASRVWGEEVTGNYFAVLGVVPALGRTFADDGGSAPGSDPVAVLSYGMWQRAFGADSGVIGRKVQVNGYPFTVVGVAPPRFAGSMRGVQADIWVPYLMRGVLAPGDGGFTQRGDRGLFVMGRLAPGATLATAQASFDVIARRLHDAYPSYWGDVHEEARAITLLAERDARVIPQLRGAVVSFLGLLMAVVGLVLLICCANVANLLLARAAGRRRDVAIRLALGASRGRLVRQLLTESALLALLGAVLGVLLAKLAMGFLVAFKPPLPIPVALDLAVDRGVLAFTAVVAGVTGLIAGAAPTLKAARLDLVPALKGGTPDGSPRRWRPALRNVLVVGQVAVCVILLAMAGLLLRSLRAAQAVDLGFDPQGIALFSIELGSQGYTEARGAAFYDDLIGRVGSLPGVRAVSLAESVPLGLSYSRRGVRVEGYQPRQGEDLEFGANIVAPGYFDVVRIPMARGRAFTVRDRAGSLPVVIVNESFADRFWPGEDPIGKRIGDGEVLREVVGVARDSRVRSLNEGATPFFYLPYLQRYEPNMILEVRTAGDPAAVVPIVRREIAALDRDLPVQVQTMEEALGLSLLPQRVGATLLGVFSVLGLVLASIGLYGVVAYAVTQRTRELGIRLALGAETRDIYRVVIRQGMSLMIVGVTIGIAVALLLTRLVRGLLFGVSPADPLTLGVVVAILTVVALLASYVPARRATRVDPLVALHEE
jgi:Acidobacterial duplicated orphan permease